MKGYKTIITPELEEKVIRCFHKGISLAAMLNMGICPRETAQKILSKHGLTKKREDIEFGKNKRHL